MAGGTAPDDRRVLDAMADAVVAVGADDVVRYANRAAERILGWPSSELAGRRFTELLAPGVAAMLAGGFATYVREHATAVVDGILRLTVTRSTGSTVDVEAVVSTSTGDDDDWVAVVSMRDPGRVGPEREVAFPLLVRASALLSSMPDYDATLRAVGDLVVPALADWCAVDVVGPDRAIRRVVLAHADPAKATAAAQLRDRLPPADSDHPLGAVLSTGEPMLLPEIPDEVLVAAAEDDEHLRLLRTLGFSSAMVVPLRARGRTLGAMTLVAAESGRRYNRADLALVDDLAGRVALAVDNARLYRDVQAAEQRFRHLVDSLDAIVWEADPATLRTIYVSHRAEEILGYPVQRWLDEPDFFWQSVLHPDDRDHVLDYCRTRLRERLPIDVEYRALAADGRTVWLRDISDFTVGADGEAHRTSGLMIDVTDRKGIENELRYQRALLETQNEHAVDGVLVVSPTGEMTSFNQRFIDLWPIPDHVVASRSDAAALQSVLDKLVDPDAFLTRVEELYTAQMAGRDELHLLDGRVFDRYGTPLRGPDGAFYGYAWYVRDITEQKQFQQQLAESGERFARLARTLQQSLLPPNLPEMPGVEVAARYLPAGRGMDVGGDFYDLFRTGARTWGIVMGDVCGKGAEAATVTALARYTVRAAAMQTRKPREILATLNEAIIRQRSGDERFVTAVYASVRRGPDGARLRIACGGHPLPLVLRESGRVMTVGRTGTLLGLFRDIEVKDASVHLRHGDALVLFTDGVIEARDEEGELFDEQRLRDLLADCAGLDAAEIAKRVEEAVLGYSAGEPADDTAVLVLRVTD